MMRKRQLEMNREIDTCVGLGTIIDGNIQCQGFLRIDGVVNGEIRVDGDLIVGESAEINGNVWANNITIGGILKGNVTTTGLLSLLPTSRLNGDINVGGLIAENGGMFIGKCCMMQPPQKLLEAVFVENRNRNASPGKLLANE